jgi:HK97 family phage portal protein
LGFYEVLENRSIFPVSGISNPEKWLINLFGGTQSKAGVNVNEETAIKVSAVFACINTISSDIAALPLHLLKTLPRGSEKAEWHPLYDLLWRLPNPETTAFEFWQMLLVNYLLTFDGYAYIKRDGSGYPIELWNIPTSNVQPYRNTETKEMFYVITDEYGKQYKAYPENIFRLRGMRFNKVDSVLKPIEIAREALGLSIATEEYGARYFSNGANPGGIVEVDGKMSDDAFKRFKESFYEKYAGVVNSNKVLFLEQGSKYQKIGNNPEESQAIETRKYQVIEVARYFNMPLYKILDYERSTYNNNEQQSIDYLRSCLNAHLVHIEQTISKDCLTPKERKKLYAKFNVKGMLRGDITAQNAFYQTMLQNGVFSPNVVLELEDQPVYEGGDIHMANGNMMPIDQIYEIWKAKIEKGGNALNERNPVP